MTPFSDTGAHGAQSAALSVTNSLRGLYRTLPQAQTYVLCMSAFAQKTFSASSYATFRPTYPASLYKTVISYHQGPRKLCLDLGTGHGIVARALAPSFDKVIGSDPSEGMIKQAKQSTPNDQYRGVNFHVASAESSPFIETGTIDLVVAAQASHWFDYAKLWPEMKRIVRSGGTLAYWGYKDHAFVDYPKATEIMNHYAYDMNPERLGPYWSQPGRSYVQDKLRVIRPPENEWQDVQRIEYEPATNGNGEGQGTLFINARMSVGQCKDYIRTWSSYHSWKDAHQGVKPRSQGGSGDVMDEMFDEIAADSPDFKDDDKKIDIEWGSALILARKR